MVKNEKKFLKVSVICLFLFLTIDCGLYIFYDFECIDALLKLLGVNSVISVILRLIIIVVAIAIKIFIDKYDANFDYSFRSKDRRKYK